MRERRLRRERRREERREEGRRGRGGKLPVSCARGAVFLDVHFNHNLRHPDDHIMSLISMAFAPALNINYEHRYKLTRPSCML